jgi:hypothetical protein
VLGERSGEPQQDGLAGGVLAHPHRRVDPRVTATVAEHDADHARRVLARERRRRAQRLADRLVVGDDERRQHHVHGGAAGVDPGPDEGAGDLRRRRVLEVDLHQGRLQVRPSRSIMASAVGGPHVPDV